MFHWPTSRMDDELFWSSTRKGIFMKGNHALALSSAINAQLEAARLNHRQPSVTDPSFDHSKVQVNMIDVVRQLDDDARAKLQEALDAAKGA